MNETEDPIVIEHLSKNYGGQVALNDLNLTITSGMCVGYLGPNGAGKTTTIKILTDLLRATSGRRILTALMSSAIPKLPLKALARSLRRRNSIHS